MVVGGLSVDLSVGRIASCWDGVGSDGTSDARSCWSGGFYWDELEPVDMVLGRARGGGGLVSGFVSGTYRVLLGRGGISWHERRAFVLV